MQQGKTSSEANHYFLAKINLCFKIELLRLCCKPLQNFGKPWWSNLRDFSATSVHSTIKKKRKKKERVKRASKKIIYNY